MYLNIILIYNTLSKYNTEQSIISQSKSSRYMVNLVLLVLLQGLHTTSNRLTGIIAPAGA